MAARDIRVGDCSSGSNNGGDIVVCHEKTAAEGREITVCADCNNPPELILSGTDEPSVDDQYSVSGGIAPFSWAFTGGVIDNSGKIISVTSCGGPDGNGAVASVSVTDACGQTASIEVRLPGGSWLWISRSTPNGCNSGTFDTQLPDGSYVCTPWWAYSYHGCYSSLGGTRVVTYHRLLDLDVPYLPCDSPGNCAGDCGFDCMTVDGVAYYMDNCAKIHHIDTYIWVC